MKNSPSSHKKPVTGRTRDLVIAVDRFILWLARHWAAVFTAGAALYVGLPILAPVLMNAGLSGAARTIYTVYSPMCHQMASRSFFLYGEQPAYPRAVAGTELTPIEAYMGDLPLFAGVPLDSYGRDYMDAARAFLGTPEMGYKMALCERDIAIYGFVFLASLLYLVLRRFRPIPALPLWAFLLIGMGPIALDGFSQLFAQLAVAAPEQLGFLGEFFPLRESTPFLRTFTGALFGFTLVWFAYPHIEPGMRHTVEELETKLRKAGVDV